MQEMDLDDVQDTFASRNAPSAIPKAHLRTAALHRIRFVDFTPASVTALALTPRTYDPAATDYPYLNSIERPDGSGRELLAVGRQDGDVEIYTWIGGGQHTAATKGESKTKRKKARREQGNRQGWVLERRLAAPHPSRVEHLLFAHQTTLSDSDKDLFDEAEQVRELEKLRRERPRLFSAGGGSDLWEWDWSDGGLGFVKRTLSSQGGAIWSMAINPSHTTLALGCDDGAVRLISLLDGELEHVRRFDATKTRLLSLAWGPQVPVQSSDAKGKGKERMAIDDEASSSSDSEDDATTKYEDALLVTGCADSTVRVWDARSGRCTYRMTTDKIKGEHTLVWSVGVLADGTVISGDSMGLVKFWDSKMGTQLQSLQASKADVLCLAIGPVGETRFSYKRSNRADLACQDGKAVYASGVDQKVTQLQRMSVNTAGNKATRAQDRSQWVIAHSRRMHSHDVRALTISPSYSFTNVTPANQVPVVISGGLDFSIVYTPASTASFSETEALSNPISDSKVTLFSESYHRKASYIPQRSAPACLAGQAKLIACRNEKGLDLWTISDKKEEGWAKALEMELSSKTNWTASAISPSGEWLAISDMTEVKVFRLRTASDGTLKAKRSHAVTAALASQSQLQNDLGAAQLHFTADSSRLILATAVGSRVVVLALPESNDGAASVLRIFNQHRLGSRQASGRTVAGRKAVNGKLANGTDHSESEEESESDADDTVTETSEVVSTIACLASSADGQWLVTADLARRMHVFNLDSLQHHSGLPSLALPPVSLAFSPSSPSIVTVALPNNTIQFFDVDSRSIPSWAKRISASPSGALITLREPLTGMVYDPTPQGQDTLIMYGSNWLCKMKVPIATTAKASDSKRKHSDEEQQDDTEAEGPRLKGTPAEVFHKYQPILLVDFTANGELVVIERPYFGMLGQMAPAFVEHKYGSS